MLNGYLPFEWMMRKNYSTVSTSNGRSLSSWEYFTGLLISHILSWNQFYINFGHCECMKQGQYLTIDDIGKSQ